LKSSSFGSPERKTILYSLVFIVFGLLAFRLFQMQIIEKESYEIKSESNSIKPIEQIPLRGVFYDRNGEILVNNIPAYTLRITPEFYDRKLNNTIEKVFDLTPGFISDILQLNKIYPKAQPIRIKRGIDFNQIAWLEENHDRLKGVDYVVEMQRGYPSGVMGAHMFGYTKEISPQLLEKQKDYYQMGDYIGYTGLERTYEKDLRGEKGFNYVLVDAKRNEVGKFKDGTQDKVSIKGKDLELSIDAEVQKVAEQELKGKRGAVVAMDPKTGEILALASAPDYDLNQFSYVTSRAYMNQLYKDPEKPQFNRATMSVKPPGSTFKILAAIAALDMGVITPSTIISCGGSWFFGRSFKCHTAHGPLNVVHAIEHSCNVFFYQLIYRIGLDKWAEYCKRFGFSQKTGIDLREEVAGFIPNTKYYEKMYGKDWPRSIMASLGIGQGEVSVTPLQLAYYTSLIANNGRTFTPHIVKGYRDDFTKKLVPYKFKEVDVNIPKKVFDVVKEGMFLVVNGGGTATSIRMNEVKIAGKTGTAQNPHGKDHAFFIGFAPYDDPKIAFAIVVENAGFGATWAAPIAKKMVQAYLLKGQKNVNTDAAPEKGDREDAGHQQARNTKNKKAGNSFNDKNVFAVLEENKLKYARRL